MRNQIDNLSKIVSPNLEIHVADPKTVDLCQQLKNKILQASHVHTSQAFLNDLNKLPSNQTSKHIQTHKSLKISAENYNQSILHLMEISHYFNPQQQLQPKTQYTSNHIVLLHPTQHHLITSAHMLDLCNND